MKLESRMHRKTHVRFGERRAETYPRKHGQRAARLLYI